MIPSDRRAGRGKGAVPGCQTGWLVLVGCVGLTLVPPPVAAQVPPASREELMRQWDIDRDGKVDASEAEIARGRMRRARTDAIMNSGTDPVTGRPRGATDPVTGRPMPPADSADRGGLSTPADDGGLILVPGNGERPGSIGGAAAGKDMPPRPSRREREALPGTRAPSMSSTIPSVSPRLPDGALPGAGSRSPGATSAAGRQGPPNARDAGGADLSSRARLLPGMPPQNPGARDPQSLGAGQGRQQPATRPGIIAGGARAGVPGARSGYGAGRPPGDLNAGRPAIQGPGVPSAPRPGVRPPDGGRSVTRTPSTVPRTPRVSTDEFYGR
jgi:hypothetical protein